MEPTYFTCTLGQASQHQDGKSFNTITEFVESQAQKEPSTPAVGFFSPTTEGQQWKSQLLTFKDVRQGSVNVAETLSSKLGSPPNQTVGLLCPSSPEFLLTWLAIMRLGHAALLIAPQCSPSAVAHLCSSCNVKFLLYDEVYESLADNALTEFSKISKSSMESLRLPFVGENVFDIIRRPLPGALWEPVTVTEADVAYLHHTSGTSTGMPKPIPQTHHGGLGVLPLLDGRQKASFTTTPLYHGGVADLFRAWTSNALIWLFPGKNIPITAGNVCRCLDAASNSAADGVIPEVKYFSSVPYVLQMMAEDKNGLRHLQHMDIVGVGGAALPAEVGDRLVDSKVNLISRFGSAECGFLMSSHREFDNDKEWQYLRSDPSKGHLKFEPQEDGLAELVIQPDWPHMAKRNRDDGSFATADLFAPHSTISNAWRYHSRADSQLTLITGKKFDPAPLEDAIRASSSLIDDALIFGNGQPYPGVLLFRSKDAASFEDHKLTKELSSYIEKLNKESQSHARIPRNMLIPMPYTDQPLEKSSKGTILRRSAEERYADNIAKAYENVLPDHTPEVSNDDIPSTIRQIVTNVVGERGHSEQDLDDDTDLFAYGVDSVGGIQIRHALSQLIPKGSTLPLTVVEDQGSISRLSALILRLRSGGSVNGTHDKDPNQHQLMLDMAKEYSTFTDPRLATNGSSQAPPPSPEDKQRGLQILLTGPTGSLGSHILHNLLSNPRISHIHLLVRGSTPHASRERVLKALTSRLLPVPEDFDSKTTIWQCKLSEPNLGLSTTDYTHLSSTVDIIIHLAWSVNFLLPLRTFASTHLSGLRNLIDLSLSSPRPTPPRLIFCSSVASVSQYPSLPSLPDPAVPEKQMTTPSSAGPTGYARSKWVAEAICLAAHRSTRLHSRISISRVGQLSGASDTGVWNASEAYPLMLSSVKATGVLPDLHNEVLNWLPVDVAARAFVQDALSDRKVGSTDQQDKAGDDIPIHHVLNPYNDVSWSDLLSCLARHESFKVVPVDEWLSCLSALQDDEKTQDHPALRLLGFWKSAYGGQNGSGDHPRHDPIEYEMYRTYAQMPCLQTGNSKGVDERYFLKLWKWIKDSV
ncbi:putative NRPS-like protein biosynthetic cluster [Elasticomyces elasticus]|uniref:Carrier domain-containing protein n=1 Tax=Exophiala sideris TaxID=1016849 RepID=A0ABR0JNF0_9EURO|nr:putative NRPS-like protein biosynthetic cluster [Elasticomyces elasticus]KAK5038029.1 hypothetical protein LTS07_001497 [Exophiala sideris]KAK5044011.1 putative NRPS-like protein biosynthetic cluster [Exophiala sideris]KAK5067510.1 hypothetical protein LTR69_001499 [Exophiala sideris]KAK5184252.1 putative NRPS-like protein biosynthetic cluster [Eurotiomycetes sp. CCFEE 6388]